MTPPRIRLRTFISPFYISVLFTTILLLLTSSINTHAVRALAPLTSLPSLDPATAFPPLLQKRQTTCPTAGNTRCPSPASRFCCPSTAECIPINNATNVICCPSGEDCSFVQSIACSSSSIPTCGSNGQCCPDGYDCDIASGGCKLQEQNKPASYKLRDECAKLNLENGGGGSTSQTCSALIEATKKSCLDACEQFPVKAIVAGFFPGLAIGATIMFLVGLWMRRREMKALGASSASSRGGGGGGGGGGIEGGRSDGVDSRSIGRHISASGGYKHSRNVNVNVLGAPGSGFGASRASKRGIHGSRGSGGDGHNFSRGTNARSNRAQSTGTTTMLSSTEIAIGYDRKQDEQFSLVSSSGRGTPRSGSIVTSPTPPPITSSILLTGSLSSAGGSISGGAARGYDNDLRSPRYCIPEELSGSMPSIELPAMPPSPKPPGSSTRGASATAASVWHTVTSPGSRTSPSPVASLSGSGGGTITPLVPVAVNTARKPLPAPLTHEHLLRHQKQHQQQQHSPNPRSIVPKAQSEYRSEAASSFASTSLSYSDDDSSDDDAVGGGTRASKDHHPQTPAGDSSYQRLAANNLDPSTAHHDHRRKKPKRPPSDVTSCITDGDHDDGLTTFSELTAAGVLTGTRHGGGSGTGGVGAVRVSQAGTKSTSIADRESMAAIGSSPFLGEGERERGEVRGRVAVDRGMPPPLPEGYGYEYSEECGRLVVVKNS